MEPLFKAILESLVETWQFFFVLGVICGWVAAFTVLPYLVLKEFLYTRRIYANWYDDEVRPLMDADERMQGLSELARKELRRQAIGRARLAE